MSFLKSAGFFLIGASAGWFVGKFGGRSPEDLPRLKGRLTMEERSLYGPLGTGDEDTSSWDLFIRNKKVGAISQSIDDNWAWRGRREGFISPPLDTEAAAREWVRRPWSD